MAINDYAAKKRQQFFTEKAKGILFSQKGTKTNRNRKYKGINQSTFQPINYFYSNKNYLF
jgi:hypothetical protein